MSLIHAIVLCTLITLIPNARKSLIIKTCCMSHHLRLVRDWVSYSFISKSFVESFTFLHFFLEVMILYPRCLLCHFTSPTRLRAIEGACYFPMNYSSSYEEIYFAALTCRWRDSAFCKYRQAVLGFATWWTSRAEFPSLYSENLIASFFGFLHLAELFS